MVKDPTSLEAPGFLHFENCKSAVITSLFRLSLENDSTLAAGQPSSSQKIYFFNPDMANRPRVGTWELLEEGWSERFFRLYTLGLVLLEMAQG